tara:strand:- start:58 stop:186 length:129 start_codon:yes stop_codon:yes gene_type:complete
MKKLFFLSYLSHRKENSASKTDVEKYHKGYLLDYAIYFFYSG